MAMVDETNAVLIAGGTGKLVLVDLASGKVLASTDIAQRVDEIAYDPGLHRAYCASGTGFISVVSVGKDSLKTLDSIPSSPGAHSIAVDPKTHTVWIAFARDNKAFVQPFEAATP
jgi:DNA-binding beta-propeller fold protein YncE